MQKVFQIGEKKDIQRKKKDFYSFDQQGTNSELPQDCIFSFSFSIV